MAVPLRTRAIWPIVALAACALAFPTNAGARGGPPGAKPSEADSGAKGHRGQPRAGRPHGHSRSRGKSSSRGRSQSRGHTRPQPHGRPQSHGRSHSSGPSRSHGAASPSRPAKRGGSGVRGESKGRSAGKVTLCHATGSSTNPYVKITVSENALKAHRAHQHGEDLIGVPAGGCPGASPAATANANEHGTVALCHATGSDTNPFVAIAIALPALAAHTRHQHGEDLVGVDGACPGARVAARVAADTAPAVTPPAPGSPAPGEASSTAPGAETSTPVAKPAAAGDVAGVSDESGPGAPEATRTGDSRDGSGSLPFTGFGLLLLVALGAASLLAGTSIRRSGNRAD